MVFGTLLKEDRSILELLDSAETWLNADFALHYGTVMNRTIEPEESSWTPKLLFTFRWIPIYLVVGLGAAQFLPDYSTSQIKTPHLASAVIVPISSLLLLREHRQTRGRSLDWDPDRWYAVGSFALVAFMIGLRIKFPRPSSFEAGILQRVALGQSVVPVIGLLAAALLIVGCRKDSRKSPLVWYCVCLILTVAHRSLYILIY